MNAILQKKVKVVNSLLRDQTRTGSKQMNKSRKPPQPQKNKGGEKRTERKRERDGVNWKPGKRRRTHDVT